MELSLFLAKLLGLYMLIAAAIMLFFQNSFKVGVRDMLGSPGMIALIGILNLIVGLAIAIGHPIWSWDWRGLITVIGYLSLFSGIFRLAFPSTQVELSRGVLEGSGYWMIFLVSLILGGILTYHGFY